MAAALEAVEAEAEAPRDGGYFTLTTEFGSADIFVPSLGKWRASARRLLISMGDDLGWAQTTLSPEDFAEYVRLDPTGEESAPFFEAVMSSAGESRPKSRPSTSSSKGTRKR